MYSQHGPGAGTPKATPWARRWALTVVQRPRSRRPRRRAGRSAEASGPGTLWAGRRYCCREAVCLLLDSVRARGPRWHSQRPAVCRRAPDTPRGLCGARPEPARQGPAEQVGAPGPGAADRRCLGAPLPPPHGPPWRTGRTHGTFRPSSAPQCALVPNALGFLSSPAKPPPGLSRRVRDGPSPGAPVPEAGHHPEPDRTCRAGQRKVFPREGTPVRGRGRTCWWRPRRSVKPPRWGSSPCSAPSRCLLKWGRGRPGLKSELSMLSGASMMEALVTGPVAGQAAVRSRPGPRRRLPRAASPHPPAVQERHRPDPGPLLAAQAPGRPTHRGKTVVRTNRRSRAPPRAPGGAGCPVPPHPGRLTFEGHRPDALLALDVPQPHGLIVRAGEQHAAVSRHGQAGHLVPGDDEPHRGRHR